MKYNFIERQTDGTFLPVTMNYIVDKSIGYDNALQTVLAGVSSLLLIGVTAANSDDRKLYVKVNVQGSDVTISIYSDAGYTSLVASGAITGNGTMTITEENVSGVSGTVVIASALIVDDATSVLLWADGSEYAPFYTILKATTVSASGGKIGLASGYYAESRVNKSIRFYGIGAAKLGFGFSAYFNDSYHNLILDFSAYSIGTDSIINVVNCMISRFPVSWNVYFKFCTITGLNVYSSGRSNFNNCTLYNVFTSNATGAGVNEIKNTIINGGSLILYNSNVYKRDYNCLYNYPISLVLLQATWTGNWINSFEAEPLFVDASSDIYSLQENSPCLGTGEETAGKLINIGAKGLGTKLSMADIYTNASNKRNCVISSGKVVLEHYNKTFADMQPALNEVVFDSSAESVDDYYNGLMLTILSGVSEGIEVEITDYNGTTKIATLAANVSVEVGDVYAVEMEIESADIDLTKGFTNGYISLHALLHNFALYGTQQKSKILLKYASNQSLLAAKSYSEFMLNAPILYDKNNNVGIGSDNYTTGIQEGFRWIKFAVKARLSI